MAETTTRERAIGDAIHRVLQDARDDATDAELAAAAAEAVVVLDPPAGEGRTPREWMLEGRGIQRLPPRAVDGPILEWGERIAVVAKEDLHLLPAVPDGGQTTPTDCERCEGGGNYSEPAPCTTSGPDCACNGPLVLVDPCPDCGGIGTVPDGGQTTDGRDERIAELERVARFLLKDIGPAGHRADEDRGPGDWEAAERPWQPTDWRHAGQRTIWLTNDEWDEVGRVVGTLDGPPVPVEGDGRAPSSSSGESERHAVLDEARVAVNAAIYALFADVQLHSRAVAAAQLAADETFVALGATAALPEERAASGESEREALIDELRAWVESQPVQVWRGVLRRKLDQLAAAPSSLSSGEQGTGYDAPSAERAREVLAEKLRKDWGLPHLAEGMVEVLVEEELLVDLWPPAASSGEQEARELVVMGGATDKVLMLVDGPLIAAGERLRVREVLSESAPAEEAR